MKTAKIRNKILLFLIALLLLQTRAWCIPSTDVLKVAVRVDNPYYAYENESGEVTGLEIDILNAIAKEIGYDRVEYCPMNDIHHCLDSLKNREVHAVLGLPSFYDGDVSNISTSSEIITTDLCMMAKNEIIEAINSNGTEKYIAAFEHNTNNYAIVANLGASLYYIAGSQEEVLDMVLSDKAQVMICDGNCMSSLLSERGLEEEFGVVRSNISTVGYTIALRKGDNALLRDINEGILKVHIDGKYEEILSHYVKASREVDIQKIIKRFILIVVAISFVALVYFFLSWRVRGILKQKVSDMTEELEKNLQQLQYESGLRNQIIEHSPNIMVLCDSDGNVVLMNSAAKKIIGFSDYDCTQKSVYALPIIGDLVASLIKTAGFASLHCTDDFLIPYRVDSLSKRSYRCNIANVYLHNSQDGFLITASDVTKEENKKQEIIEQEKSTALSRLVAGIAHEIKNPLAGIQNFADLIKTEKENQQFWDYFSEYVPIEISRISRLIESLMDYAKPSKGTKTCAEVKPLINECTYLISTAARSANISLEIDIQEDMWIYVVRDQIKQVIINIIVNSMEAVERFRANTDDSDPNRGIRIQAYRDADRVKINISDNGEGMSEEALRNCMDPFFTTKERGTGLGLAISRQFVQENGGTMSIGSEVNKGTTITLTFKEDKHEKENFNH